MEQCSIPVQHASGKVRPRAHNAAPGWSLRGLLGSLVQNTSLHRPVFRFPLPVFPGVKRGPFEQATGQGLFSCGVPDKKACHGSQPVNSSCSSSNQDGMKSYRQVSHALSKVEAYVNGRMLSFPCPCIPRKFPWCIRMSHP
ncbi:uncharacterized protein TrAtP1_000666 [Trichoderma atroviride]|uniref:uncharacterized protein n=1 Tax=Hypocrea atroviridis TaxID=63577 RepID=UPI0033304C9F|nr:hypothetical protein TrAtP1_000666 [Trichoderma atroviride]